MSKSIKKDNRPTLTLAKAIKEAMINNDTDAINIKDKIVDVDNLSLPSNKRFNQIAFKNVKFISSNQDTINITVANDYSTRFENCEFTLKVIFNGGIVSFKDCDIKNVSIDNSGENVYIDNCKCNTSYFLITNASRVYMEKLTNVKEIIVDGAHGDLFFKAIDVSDNISVLDALSDYISVADAKCKQLFISKCMFRKINIQELTTPEIFLNSTYIRSALNINSSKVDLLNCYYTSNFGSFIYDTKNIKKIHSHCSTGIELPKHVITLYKKCDLYENGKYTDKVIARLTVPANAKRVYTEGLKIRVSEAKVEEFLTLAGKPFKLNENQKVRSNYDINYDYAAGKTVKPKHKFDPTSGHCGSGIHGFIKLTDAMQY